MRCLSAALLLAAGACSARSPTMVDSEEARAPEEIPSVAATRGDAGARGVAARDAEAPTDAAPVVVRDRFGVLAMYPTAPGGRTWTLPDDAESPSSEWNVEENLVTRVSPGVFHTLGNDGEVRLTVGSPRGRAWWRNVEMTGYFRYTAAHDANDQARHWELLARSERHAAGRVPASGIAAGVLPPDGTRTWPGFPFGGAVRASCLGASYHGNFYLDGTGLFEKELSHPGGYAAPRAEQRMRGFASPQGRWFGLKLVVRNASADMRVELELWLDAEADGTWQRLTTTDDASGRWPARVPAELDGCDEPPFSYRTAQLITWAGPWIIFRSDSLEMDFRWLSAREIAPRP